MKLKTRRILVYFILSFLLTPAISYSQKTAFYSNANNDFNDAMELYRKEKYSFAQDIFEMIIVKCGPGKSVTKMDAQYYSSLCAIELGHRNGEALLSNFINYNPESTNIKEASFKMGLFNYKKKRWRKVITWLNKIRPYNLEKSQRDEYYFKIGYSYFMQKDYEKAGQAFMAVKNKQSKYTSAANYYYGHISYQDEKYDNALPAFLSIKDDPAFKEVVPFYISQIYFKKKEYDKVIEFAIPLLDSPNTESKSDIAEMIGDAYYYQSEFKDAASYYEIARGDTKKTFNNDAVYRMAHSYYKSDDFESAIKEFEKISSLKSKLGQNSAFHLADCYLKEGNKIRARSAFSAAMKLDFDQKIKEESLFSFAKLTYDLAYSPFNETIRAFDNFISLFPQSEHINQVYDYLVKVYITAKNYKDALSSLDKIEDKSAELKAAYQRIAFYRALELFNNLQYQEAIEYIDKSLVYFWYDKSIRALSYYWKAEAFYRMENYSEAIKFYNEFMKSSAAYDLPEYKLTQYNLGYTYFKNEKYQESISWFKKYIRNNSKGTPKVVSDAYNRLGDCYFLSRSYWQAIENYDKAISLKQSDSDYALFQKGFCMGLLDRPQRKVDFLNELIEKYPKSTYCDDALFELSKSSMTLNQSLAAESYCKRIIDNYPNSSYVKKAMQQLGLIYYNANKNEDAIRMYKKVVTSFPGTEEARNSVSGIKNIMVEMNQVEEYFAYIRSIGGQDDISINEQDSLTYRAAENIYLSGALKRAKEQFNKYIRSFPQGRYILSAHYYKADCNYRDDEIEAALSSYEYITNRGRNDYTELALLRVAELNYRRGRYDRSLMAFTDLENMAEMKANILEARLGKMRCNYMLEKYTLVIDNANTLLLTDKIPDEIIREAYYKLGKSYLVSNDLVAALDVFEIIAEDVKNSEGAEAKFWVASIKFKQSKFDESEAVILDFIKKNTSHSYWLAKSYILWADIYMERNEVFQAKATLESIIENYGNKDDDILGMANSRLNNIKTENKIEEK